MLVLHEDEPGAREFVTAMRERGVPTDAWRMRFDLDPSVPCAAAAAQPADRAHASRARGRARPAGGRARPRSDPRQHQARLQRVSLQPARRRCRSRSGPLRTSPDRDLARPRPLSRRDRGVPRARTSPSCTTASRRGRSRLRRPAPTRLCAVGRLIPIKGFDVLLGAFASARKELSGPDSRDRRGGPARGASSAPQAPDGVTFLGRVAPVQDVYERNAIVVVPSRGEGFGMVALEAAERGRAAIVSDVGGLPEIVADGETGTRRPRRRTPTALATAIVALARDAERRARSTATPRARRALDRSRPAPPPTASRPSTPS